MTATTVDSTAPAPQAAGEHAPGQGLVRRLRPLVALLGPHRSTLRWAILWGAVNHLLAIASAVLGAYLVGRAAAGATGEQLRPLFILLLVLVVPQAVTPWLETVLAHMMAFRVLVDIRDRVQAAFARLAPGYLLDRRTGDLGSAVVGDIELLEAGLPCGGGGADQKEAGRAEEAGGG